MPATIVGTEIRPAYAVILRMSLFCRSVIFASTASTSVVSSSSKPVTRSVTVERWSSTSRKYERTSCGTSEE